MALWTADIVTHGYDEHWDQVTHLPRRRIRLSPYMVTGPMEPYIQAAKQFNAPVEYDAKERAFFCTWSNWQIVKSIWQKWTKSIREEFSPTFLQKLIDLEKQIQPDQLVPLAELESKLGSTVWQRMHSYQQYGVQFMVSRKKALMSDDMGCGKTMQAIVTATYFLKEGLGPVLIACPKIVQNNWAVEVKKWLGFQDADVWCVKDTKDFLKNRYQSEAKFIIIGHRLFQQKKMVQELTRKPTAEELDADYERATSRIRPYRIVVVDESHKMKAKDGDLSRILVNHIIEPARVAILMSGTPSSKAHELWTTVYSMAPGLYKQFFHYKKREIPPMTDRETFAERYCKIEQQWVPGRPNAGWNFNGFENSLELHAVLSLFTIRRPKERAFKNLCGETRQIITLPEPSPSEQKQLKEWLAKAKPKPLPQNPDVKQVNQTAFMKAYLETANIKVKVVRDFMNDYLIPNVLQDESSSKEKILIFFTHNVMRQMLEEVLTEAKIGWFSIYGETKQSDRIAYQESFQNENDMTYQVALLSVEAAGVGIDLTRSNQVYFAEFNFSVDSLEQAKARVVRLNQTRHVMIYYLLQPHTTDDIAWMILKSKMRNSSKALDGVSRELSASRSSGLHGMQINEKNYEEYDDQDEEYNNNEGPMIIVDQ